MKYHLNVITPLGKFVSEAYESDLSVDDIHRNEFDAFRGSPHYAFKMRDQTPVFLNSEVTKNSILIINMLDEDTASQKG